MRIHALKAFQDNYIWIIHDTSSFFCVDPGNARPVLDYANSKHIDLKAIFITHEHADHIDGVKQLMQYYPNASLYMPNRHTKNIKQAPYTFNILQTPGHTDNHVCYLEPNQHWLFCGDTLFSAGCGRAFNSIEALFDSLNILKQLPDHTQIFCGHEYTRQNLRFAQTVEPDNFIAKQHLDMLETNPEQISLPSSIGFEKKINPFLRLDSPSIQAYTGEHTPFAVFKALRAAKDCF
jgi:hydroxyacylglutathione hydrolase